MLIEREEKKTTPKLTSLEEFVEEVLHPRQVVVHLGDVRLAGERLLAQVVVVCRRTSAVGARGAGREALLNEEGSIGDVARVPEGEDLVVQLRDERQFLLLTLSTGVEGFALLVDFRNYKKARKYPRYRGSFFLKSMSVPLS